jgi:ribosomal protein S18 acetylase RimI-like enzyme
MEKESKPTTIRPVAPHDMDALMALIEAVGLFPPDEIEELRGMLTQYFAGTGGDDHFWITDDDEGLAGVAYYAPERMTEGTWNLYFIGVHPDRRREGRASALLAYVEEALAARGERLLLVETSSLPTFERAWALYRKCGYDEEARIRDFYAAGSDKIVFRKALPLPEPASRS